MRPRDTGKPIMNHFTTVGAGDDTDPNIALDAALKILVGILARQTAQEIINGPLEKSGLLLLGVLLSFGFVIVYRVCVK